VDLDTDVDVATLVPSEWALDTLEQDRRALAHLLIEPFPDREHQPVERHLVGDVRVADRTEQDCVGRPEALDTVVGHHRPRRKVPFASPVELGGGERTTGRVCHVLDQRPDGVDYFPSDTVAGYECDLVCHGHATSDGCKSVGVS
jgi:hypothetical protein